MPKDLLWIQADFDDCSANMVETITETLTERLATRAAPTPEELLPWIVTGEWGWPFRWVLSDRSSVWRQGRLFVSRGLTPRFKFPASGDVQGVRAPVLLRGKPATPLRLRSLASEVGRVLEAFEEGDDAAYARLRPQLEGTITRQPQLDSMAMWELRERLPEREFYRQLPPGRRLFRWEDRPRGHDFAVYCFTLLAEILVGGHSWRVTRCGQCRGFFLKVRHDPPERPARFCSDQCRRGWHNPRRGKERNA